MMSQLYARRKNHLPVTETEQTSEATAFAHRQNDHIRRKQNTFDVRAAVTAFVGFLTVGLFLGYLLLHHQHRRVVLHVLQHPWTHGHALLHGQRHGFVHHFYNGSPRFVTVVMPSTINPADRKQRLESIQDTWGGAGRAIFLVHNVSDFQKAAHALISQTSTPRDPYSFPQLLLVPPDIGLEDGLPRLFYAIRAILNKVNPEFAFFVNDVRFITNG
jgi:hypothetical protein